VRGTPRLARLARALRGRQAEARRCGTHLAGQRHASGVAGARAAASAPAALADLGMDALAAAPALATFRPLPNRLQPLGAHDGIDWINDSISTTPQATLAALDSLAGREVTVIVGGHDRGLDWSGFVAAVKDRSGLRVVAQGANGPRIAQALRQAKTELPLGEAESFDEAVEMAR